MMTLPLTHRLDRTVVIDAPRPIVFEFFQHDDRWASWWGAGSTIEPRPGGKAYIRHPGGVEVTGEVLEIHPPDRLVFTYGFVGGQPIGPGQSRVTITLEPAGRGTRLHLVHEFADASVRDEHVQGWRFQLSLFANAIANRLHAGAAETVDRWFAAWADPDVQTRSATLASIAGDDVVVRDRFSLLTGLDDLSSHITAAQRFMPGVRLTRSGDVRQCQGTLLVDWKAVGGDGAVKGSGSNVFTLNADGRITSVVGFWNG